MDKINTFYFVPSNSSISKDNNVIIYVNRSNLLDIAIPALEKYIDPFDSRVQDASKANIKWPFIKIDGDLNSDQLNELLTLQIFEIKLNQNFDIVDVDCINDKIDIISVIHEFMCKEAELKFLEKKKSVI